MASAIIVEDGTIIAGANGFVSNADARTYAARRGVTLPADETACDVLNFKAVDYLETQSYKGELAFPDTQELSWPRINVGTLYGIVDFPNNVIPDGLIKANIQLMIDQVNGVDLMASSASASFITEDTVGSITTKYSERIGSQGPSTPIVDAFLSDLTVDNGFSLKTVRV